VVSTTDPPSLTRHEERLERFIRVGEAIQAELDAYTTGILPDLHTLVIRSRRGYLVPMHRTDQDHKVLTGTRRYITRTRTIIDVNVPSLYRLRRAAPRRLETMPEGVEK
jgi:hypothetical protein